MQVAAEMRQNGNTHGRSNATGIKNTHKYDGRQSHNAKMGHTEVRFVAGNSKGFNVDRSLKQFMAVAKDQDDEFTILPLAGIINMFCIGADVPNSKDEIEQYF
jgi:hypothetical protein